MITIEVWSDVVCPFCAIGKKNLEKALEQFRAPVQVLYECFELDPDAPKDQKESINEILARKYGRTVEWAERMNRQVTHRAEQVGLTFHTEKIQPTNSFDAHRLILFANSRGKQNEVVQRLFEAYFQNGEKISDASVLLQIAQECGVDRAETQQMLSGDAYADQVRADEREAEELGISGIPFFVVNRKYAVSGAQPPEAFLELLNQAMSESE